MKIIITESQHNFLVEQLPEPGDTGYEVKKPTKSQQKRSDDAEEEIGIKNEPTNVSIDGFYNPKDKHTILSILQFGTAFIPYAGPFISAGIGLYDAKTYYDEGDNKTAGLISVLSMIPFITEIPGVKQFGAKGMALIANKLSLGTKLTNVEIKILKLIESNKSLIKEQLTNSSKKLSPVVMNIKSMKPSYIERFGQNSYDKLLTDYLSGVLDMENFIKTLKSAKKSFPKLSNFVSKFGVKFTQNELKQIHQYTIMIKKLPKVLTKGVLDSINPTIQVITKNGYKTIKLKFITSKQAIKMWGENYGTIFGGAMDDEIYFIVDNIKKMSEGDLDQLFYHEFAHIKDPSTVSSKLMNLYNGDVERYSKEYFSKSYYFHPRELVANTSKILNGFSVNLKRTMKSIGKDRALQSLEDIINWSKGIKKDFTDDMVKILGYDQKFVKEHLDFLSQKNPKEYRNLISKIAQQANYLKSQVKIAM